MIRIKIVDAYANEGPNGGYGIYTGHGSHKRSYKKATEAAKRSLSASKRAGDEWAASGTPILWEMTVTRPNGETLRTQDRSKWQLAG